MRVTLLRNWPLLIVVGLIAFAMIVVRSGASLQTLPALGGVEGDTYELTIEVADALNLPSNAHVRLGGADIGTVREIGTSDYRALLQVAIQEGVELPVGTTAEVRQATPLGDLFVALTAPTKQSGPLLANGDTIDLAHTRSAPQIEDVLAAASVVVNGGALTDLGAIVREMNALLGGNESHVGGLVTSVGQVADVLNQRSADIDAQMTEINALSRTLRKGSDTIRRGLVDFSPAIEVAADERADIMRLARKLTRLGVPLQHLITTSSDDLIASLDGVTSSLEGLADIGARLDPTLKDMLLLADVVAFSSRGENLAGVAFLRLSPTLIQSILDLVTGVVTP